jgi:hypothetical protein
VSIFGHVENVFTLTDFVAALLVCALFNISAFPTGQR